MLCLASADHSNLSFQTCIRLFARTTLRSLTLSWTRIRLAGIQAVATLFLSEHLLLLCPPKVSREDTLRSKDSCVPSHILSAQGFLKEMGILDLIVHSEKEYIELSLNIANNATLRSYFTDLIKVLCFFLLRNVFVSQPRFFCRLEARFFLKMILW